MYILIIIRVSTDKRSVHSSWTWSSIRLFSLCCPNVDNTYISIYAAPTSPPQNVTVKVQSSTAIFISWAAPLMEEQNGIIQLYQIVLYELNTLHTFSYERTAQHNELLITSLHPFYNYSCTVAAQTVKLGPYSPIITVTTEEDGMYVICALFSY